MNHPDLHYTTVDPSESGLYFKCICMQSECPLKDVPAYAHIGSTGNFSFKTESEKCICSRCHQIVGQVLGVILNQCQWSFKGELKEGGIRESDPKAAHSNYNLVEIEQFSWSWLHLKVSPLEGFAAPPRKRSRHSEESEESAVVKEEYRQSVIEPSQNMLVLQTAGFPSLETIREDVQRKQEIIDILKAETRHKEKEKQTLEEKVRKLREEVERLRKAKGTNK